MPKMRIAPIRILPLLLLAPLCLAQPGPLTLDQCIQLALAAPSSVSVARQQTVIARYGITAARAGLFPILTFQNNYLYNTPGGPGGFRFVALNAPREYNSVGNADMIVDTSRRVHAEIDRARADLRLAQAQLVISQRDVRRLVNTAYFRLLLARRLVLVTRDALAEAQRFQNLTTQLFNGGEAAQADVIKASADTLFQQQAVSNAELEAQLANHELASFWTADTNTLLNIVDTLDASATPILAETSQPFLQRPEFASFDAAREGLLADVRRARADLLPQMKITYQYGIDSTRLNFQDRGQAIIANLTIPVFDWNRARSNMGQARAQADQVEANRAQAERTFSREYQDAVSRVNQVFAQLQLTDEQVRLSTENLRLARVRYQGGEGLALEVVAAQTQLAQARANQYTAKANYSNARADLEVAAGR
ncbi:MAG: TolC family protein [Acidobacteriota bacterium]